MSRRRNTAGPAAGGNELVRDLDRASAWTLRVGGTPQSHVDLDDPTHLEFEYVRRMATALDLIAPAGKPLRALHLGGGALTLPRYLAATRPGSPQRVAEIDGELVDLVRRALPLDPRATIKVRVADAREVVSGARSGGYDVVLLDVFAGAQTPAHLCSVEFFEQVARVLDADGVLIANVSDGPPLRHVRHQVATIRSVLPQGCLIADAGVLRGRRHGNLVVVAARRPLPVAQLSRRAAGDWFPGRVEADLARFAGGLAPVTDANAAPSPEPPAGLFG